MSKNPYRFKLGKLDCLVVKDGEQSLKANQVFSNVQAEIYQAILRTSNEDRENILVSANCLVVDNTLLIDTGLGAFIQPEGVLNEILKAEKIQVEAIILSHVHADHYGGLIDKDGAINFPNIPVYVFQDEWQSATVGDYAQRNPRRSEMIRKYLLPIESEIKLMSKAEILPDISFMPLAGHTPFHSGVAIESEGEILLYIGDALIHELHLENLDWEFLYDDEHKTAQESRIKLAEWAIEHDALVLAYHFPFPGLGRIKRNGEAYQWVAIGS